MAVPPYTTGGYDEKSYDMEKTAYSSETNSPTHDGLIQHHGKLMREDGAVPGETFEIGDT